MKNVISTNNKSEINYSINALKCIAIFAVIIIHSGIYHVEGDIGKALVAISRFAVPVFFLISGFYSFYVDEEYALKKYEKRIIRLIILIIISNIIYTLFYSITDPNYKIMSLFTVKQCITYIFFNVAPSKGYHLWFLQALLYCYLIFWGMTKLKVKISKGYILIPILILLALIFCELFIFMGIKIHPMYYRNFLFMGLPFFYLGYFIHDKESKINEMPNLFTIVCIIASVIITLLEFSIMPGRMDITLGSTLLAISLFILCVNNPNYDIPIISWIGGNLYTSMYILHLLVILIVNLWLKLDLGYFNLIIYFAVTALISLAIHIIIQSINQSVNSENDYSQMTQTYTNQETIQPKQSITDEEAEEMFVRIREKVMKEMEEERRQNKK